MYIFLFWSHGKEGPIESMLAQAMHMSVCLYISKQLFLEFVDLFLLKFWTAILTYNQKIVAEVDFRENLLFVFKWAQRF